MTPDKKLISICVPVFNEESNIVPFHERLAPILEAMSDRYRFELVFTDNHSEDRTFELLRDLAARDPRVHVIRFSRNFGFQRSILTAYNNCRGDAALQIDVDLQDPPELLPEFLRLWEEGYKVVYGVRRGRATEASLLRHLRKLFYRLVDFLSDDHLPHDAGDFRLIDRVILDHLKTTTDQQPYLRGIIAAVGFRQTGIVYDRADRRFGHSNFNLARLVGLALDGILQHSIVPLRLATFAGLAMSALAVLASLWYVFSRLLLPDDWPPGIATTTILILFSIGMNALFLGIIGEYIGRIYRNGKQLPITIVEAVINNRPEEPAGPARQTAGDVACRS